MFNNVGKALAGFCFVCCCQALLGQSPEFIVHGTIVLILHAKDRILVAADSKGSGTGASDTYKECKITPLDKWTFFTAIGNVVMEDKKDGKLYYIYQARKLSKETFARFKNQPNSSSRTKSMANYWGKTVSDEIRAFIATRRSVPTTPDGQVLKAVFVSNTPPMDWTLYEVEIMTDPPNPPNGPTIHGELQTVTYNVHSENIPLDITKGLNAEYRSLVLEAVAGQTPRSVIAKNKMQEIIRADPTMDRVAFGLEYILATVEEWAGAKSNIGGPVDLLELNSTGVHWLHVKDECRHPNQ